MTRSNPSIIPGGVFAGNGNGSPVITTVTVRAGTSTASFYYKNSQVNTTATVTISGMVSGNALTKSATISIMP